MVQNNVLNPKLTVIVQKDIINALICIIVSLKIEQICVQDFYRQIVIDIKVIINHMLMVFADL